MVYNSTKRIDTLSLYGVVNMYNGIYCRLVTILVENFDWLERGKIEGGHRLREDLRLDSVGLISLQVEVEDVFALRFDPLESDLVEVFSTVDSLIRHIVSTRESM